MDFLRSIYLRNQKVRQELLDEFVFGYGRLKTMIDGLEFMSADGAPPNMNRLVRTHAFRPFGLDQMGFALCAFCGDAQSGNGGRHTDSSLSA
jgi:hypothetical protein